MKFKHTLKALREVLHNVAVVSLAYAAFGDKAYGYIFTVVSFMIGLLITIWEDTNE